MIQASPLFVIFRRWQKITVQAFWIPFPQLLEIIVKYFTFSFLLPVFQCMKPHIAMWSHPVLNTLANGWFFRYGIEYKLTSLANRNHSCCSNTHKYGSDNRIASKTTKYKIPTGIYKIGRYLYSCNEKLTAVNPLGPELNVCSDLHETGIYKQTTQEHKELYLRYVQCHAASSIHITYGTTGLKSFITVN